jgi:hypothetical protein
MAVIFVGMKTLEGVGWVVKSARRARANFGR